LQNQPRAVDGVNATASAFLHDQDPKATLTLAIQSPPCFRAGRSARQRRTSDPGDI